MKDSYGCPGDVMVDAHIGAWVGELPNCFKAINSEDAASGYFQHPDTLSQENQSQSVPINIKTLAQHLTDTSSMQSGRRAMAVQI
jgi:hypothetical protein